MGVNASKSARSSPKTPARESPRFASIYHSWLGYSGFGWQFIYGLITLTMITGFFQEGSTATLLGLECVTIVVYLTLFWTNSAWYSTTFASRRYLKIDMNDTQVISSETPKYDKVTERDAKFHNDQKHFSVALKSHTFIIIFLIAFLATQGTANPSPDFNTWPAVYDALHTQQRDIIRVFQLFVIGVAASCGTIMLDTQSCLFHTTIVAINDDLINGRFGPGVGLRTSPELVNQPGQMIGVVTDKGTVINSAYARSYLPNQQ